MLLHEASPIAYQVNKLLQPFCKQILTAGSIRRMKPEVKDIELVANVQYIELTQGYDLWNIPIKKTVIHPGWLEAVYNIPGAKFLKGKPTGRYMQIELPEGIKLDLFMPQEPDFWRIMAMRTGSAEYSKYVIATGWVKKGWVGTDDGLRLKKQCKQTPDGWRCVFLHPTLPPKWESEPEFFEWLNVPYKDPRDREM